MPNPKISIVIPTLNSSKYLPACLSTLRKQDYEPLETIIVDGGSTDGTKEIVEANGGLISVFISEPDSGQPEAVTKGLAMTTGSIIHWHAADDIFMPGALHRVARELTTHPDVDLVFSDGWAFADGQLWANWSSRCTYFWDTLLYFGRFQSDCAYWRREITDQALPIDPTIPLICDEDFFLRLWVNRRFRWINHRLGAFRVRADQLSKTLDRSHLKRDRTASRSRVMAKLDLQPKSLKYKKLQHLPLYFARGVLAPRFERTIRYAWRTVTFDMSRKRTAKWFYSSWIEEAEK